MTCLNPGANVGLNTSLARGQRDYKEPDGGTPHPVPTTIDYASKILFGNRSDDIRRAAQISEERALSPEATHLQSPS